MYHFDYTQKIYNLKNTHKCVFMHIYVYMRNVFITNS